MAEKSEKVRLYSPDKYELVNPETKKLFKRYERDMVLRELSPCSIYNYLTDLKAQACWVLDNQDNTSVLEWSEDDITDFLFYCKQIGNNSRRMKRRMSSISAFFTYLRKKRLIKENPMEFIDRPKKDSDVLVQTYLTKEQIDEMRIKLDEYVAKQRNPRDVDVAMTMRLYVFFSLSTLARVNAVRNVRWDMLDLDERVVSNVLEKEGKVVELYFNDHVKGLFAELKSFREENQIPDGGFVFPGYARGHKVPITAGALNDWCKKVGNMIGVPTLHPHDFRHSGATLLKNAGMTLEDVSSLLHHESTETSRKFYLKEDTARVQAAKDQFEI